MRRRCRWAHPADPAGCRRRRRRRPRIPHRTAASGLDEAVVVAGSKRNHQRRIITARTNARGLRESVIDQGPNLSRGARRTPAADYATCTPARWASSTPFCRWVFESVLSPVAPSTRVNDRASRTPRNTLEDSCARQAAATNHSGRRKITPTGRSSKPLLQPSVDIARPQSPVRESPHTSVCPGPLRFGDEADEPGHRDLAPDPYPRVAGSANIGGVARYLLH